MCVHFVFAYFSILCSLCNVHIYCIFLFCLFVHVPAYLVPHIAAYFVHISAYLNLHIMAYLPSYISKHIIHTSAYKCVFMHIAYFAHTLHIFHLHMHIFIYFLHILYCIFRAHLKDISADFNLHIMEHLPLCIFKLISIRAFTLMHIQAYFSILKLIVPSKANQFNKYSNCCGGATRARLLSPADSPLSQLQSTSCASKNPGEARCQ